MVNRCLKQASIAFIIETKNFKEKPHFAIYGRTNSAKKKFGLSDICALKSKTTFGIDDPFKYLFSYTHASQWICVIYKLICGKQRFSPAFVWICVCELYCCSFLANIAFQPVMLVVCRNKLFVHGTVIKQSKPIASRLHSVRFCIFHWKGHEVLYGDLFLCLCKAGNETCSKMCASRLLLHYWYRWYQL